MKNSSEQKNDGKCHYLPEKILELYPFQKIGVSFLQRNRYALLADEPGLGKSAQTIRALDGLNINVCIICCPSIARITWLREFQKWQTIPRKIRVLYKLKDRPNPDDEVIICSFRYARENFKALMDRQWGALVVDEWHFLVNIKAQQTQNIMGKTGLIRKVNRFWALTGTPYANNPADLWPLLFTGGVTKLKYDDFVDRFCKTYDFNGEKVISGAKPHMLSELRGLLNKIMIHRKKREVLKDLPSVSINKLPLEADLEKLTPELKEQWDRVEHFLGEGSKGLTPLQQLGVLEGMAESIATLRRYLALMKLKPYTELLKQELSNNQYEKIIVFGIHREALRLLVENLKEFNPVLVNGETTPAQRQINLDRFQNDPSCRLLAANIKTAGTNLTLTVAHHVDFLEQEYSPIHNQQALDRTHRIGQSHPVTVRIVTIANTFDERLEEILSSKMKDIYELLG